jgi:hypothetical protein
MADQHVYLYHYTTIDAFINIVNEQEIWASNIFYLNDSAEFHLALQLARELLKAEIDSAPGDVHAQRLEGVYKSLDEVGSHLIKMPAFVWSLSKKGDDLSQWRAYCRNGGVAIGFRRDDLHYLTQHQGLGFAPELVRCVYEEEEQRRLIRSCIDEAVKAVPGGRIGQSMSPDEVDLFKGMLLKRILVPSRLPRLSWELDLRPGDSGSTLRDGLLHVNGFA